MELVHNNLFKFFKTKPVLKGRLVIIDKSKIRIHKGNYLLSYIMKIREGE